MKKVKCSNGHFFDADRFATCPSCGAEPVGQVSVPSDRPIAQPSSTQPLMPPAGLDLPPIPSAPAPNTETHSSQDAKPPCHTDPPQQNELPAPREPIPLANVSSGSSELAAAVKATASTNTSPLPKTVAYYDAGEVEPPLDGWSVFGEYIPATLLRVKQAEIELAAIWIWTSACRMMVRFQGIPMQSLSMNLKIVFSIYRLELAAVLHTTTGI